MIYMFKVFNTNKVNKFYIFRDDGVLEEEAPKEKICLENLLQKESNGINPIKRKFNLHILIKKKLKQKEESHLKRSVRRLIICIFYYFF